MGNYPVGNHSAYLTKKLSTFTSRQSDRRVITLIPNKGDEWSKRCQYHAKCDSVSLIRKKWNVRWKGAGSSKGDKKDTHSWVRHCWHYWSLESAAAISLLPAACQWLSRQ